MTMPVDVRSRVELLLTRRSATLLSLPIPQFLEKYPVGFDAVADGKVEAYLCGRSLTLHARQHRGRDGGLFCPSMLEPIADRFLIYAQSLQCHIEGGIILRALGDALLFL